MTASMCQGRMLGVLCDGVDVNCAPAGLFWPAAVLLLLSWIVLLAGELLLAAPGTSSESIVKVHGTSTAARVRCSVPFQDVVIITDGGGVQPREVSGVVTRAGS